MIPTKFWFIWPSGFRGEDFLEIDQSKTRNAYGGHVYYRIAEMSNRHRGSSIYVSYQVLVHMSKRSQKRRFLEIDQSKQELPVADMFAKESDQNEHSL